MLGLEGLQREEYHGDEQAEGTWGTKCHLGNY